MQPSDVEKNASGAECPSRRRIVKAARARFLANGFRSVTMDDLAEALGMSKKTLYAHFASKQALLEAVLLDKFGEIEAEFARISSECSADFLGCLHRLLACVQRHTEEIQPPFLRDIQRESPELFQVVEGRRRELIQRHFGQLFEEGRREGLIRKDVPVPLVIEVLLGAVTAVMNPPKIAELGLTPTAVFTGIIRVTLEGVLSPKGRAER
ncbi:MAG: TetR/AcrR family transcriptional regulator [Gemmataceae bacterium]